MKSFTIFFILVVVSLAVSVAGIPSETTVKMSTTTKIKPKPPLRPEPFKTVRPPAAIAEIQDAPSTLSTTSRTSTTTTPSKDPITCSTTPECGVMCANLTLTGGVVQSPNYPLDYGDNRNCIVTITVLPAKKKIQLTFTTFNLETAGTTKGFDYIDVIDGKSLALLLNDVSGKKIPPVVSTSTNKMVIKFTSDRNNQTPSKLTYNWKATFTMF